MFLGEGNVFLIGAVIRRRGRLVHGLHREGVVAMVLTVAAEAEEPEIRQPTLPGGSGFVAEGRAVALQDIFGDLFQAHATQAARRPVEVMLDDLAVDTDRLEDLGAAVRGQRRDPHLGHDLEQPRLDGRAEVVDRLLRIERLHAALAGETTHRLECQVRVDGARAVTDQAGEMVDVPGIARFNNNVGSHAQARADQMLVDSARRQQHRNRRVPRVDTPIREYEQRFPVQDCVRSVSPKSIKRGFQAIRTGGRVEKAFQNPCLQSRLLEPLQSIELALHQDRAGELDQQRVLLGLFQHAAPGTGVRVQAHDELFAEGIDRRIRDLGEPLFEEGIERPRVSREHGERGVIAH